MSRRNMESDNVVDSDSDSAFNAITDAVVDRLMSMLGIPRKFTWPFGDWDYDSLIYGDFPLHDLPKTVLLDVARHLNNNGRRAMSQTCSKFWNLLVDNKTIDRRVVEKDNFVEVYPQSMISLSKPKKTFMELASFKEYMTKELPLHSTAERVWITYHTSPAFPYPSPTVPELMAAMEGYCSVFGLRKAFSSGLKMKDMIKNFRELQNVEALIVTDNTELSQMRLLFTICMRLRITVPPRTFAFRLSIDPVRNDLQVKPEELPEVFTRRNPNKHTWNHRYRYRHHHRRVYTSSDDDDY